MVHAPEELTVVSGSIGLLLIDRANEWEGVGSFDEGCRPGNQVLLLQLRPVKAMGSVCSSSRRNGRA